MRDVRPTRRGLLKAGLATLGGVALAGCDGVKGSDIVSKLFDAEEALTFKVQSAILGPSALAREYTEADITTAFKANGSTDPQDEAYKAMAADGFDAFKLVLDTVGVKEAARYVVFHCADTPDEASFGDEPAHFYGSIDLTAARHEQTILAYDMNGAPLDVPHGAPLRLRVERQLGYKMSKYVMRMELVESFAQIGDGRGGYWEDNGYTWYAGV